LLWTLAAGVAEAIYFGTLARALDLGRLGAVYTVSRGGAVLVVWPLSIVLFSEIATATSAAGSVLVLFGLGLSSLGSTGGGNQRHRAGIAWAAACAISIAGYHLSYKAALLSGGNPSATFAVSLGLSAVISVIRIGSEGRRTLVTVVRARAPRILLMGVVCGGSFLILMEALARGGSGYVLTLRNTSVLFAAGLAWTIGERPRGSEMIGAVFVAAGAVLMSL
ncbi:MAG: EamA family transporter, partial [Polyangiales bacterium]